MKVLIVEDDVRVGATLVRRFMEKGYDVELKNNGRAATEVDPSPFDVIILDVNVSGTDGFSLLTRYRARTAACILVLTARTELQARLRAFQGGATDFLAKPFFVEELFARIETRRSSRPPSSARVRLSPLHEIELDVDARQLYDNGQLIPVTTNEMNVLLYLVERPNRAVPRDQLAQETLSEKNVDPRTVDSHVARLRRKLGPAGDKIRTVWGLGYRFDAPEEALATKSTGLRGPTKS